MNIKISDIIIIMSLLIIILLFAYFDKPVRDIEFDLNQYNKHYNPYLEKILTKPTADISLIDKELKCLALNLYHEARGEGVIGMLLVGHVTLNRVDSKLFPNSICEVVYQDSQFSWVKLIKNHTPKNKELYKKALELSKLLMNRDFDRSNGALFYINRENVNKIPRWVNIYTKVQKYNNHEFYTTSKL